MMVRCKTGLDWSSRWGFSAVLEFCFAYGIFGVIRMIGGEGGNWISFPSASTLSFGSLCVLAYMIYDTVLIVLLGGTCAQIHNEQFG
jgi:hypothetical protein